MGTLADIPFLSGYNEQDRINRGRENTDLDRAGAIQGLLAKMQAQKAQQAIIGVMSSNAPTEVKLQQVMRLPGGIEVAGKLAQMQEHQAKARQIGIPKPAEPYTLSPGSQRFGPDNALLASVPPTPHAPPVERFSNLNRLLKEAQDPSLTPEQRAIYVNAIRKQSETEKQISPTVVMPRQESPVQIYTDGAGKLWERERGGKWTLAQMGAGAPAMTDKVQKVPGALNPAKLAEQNAQMDAVEKQIDELKAIIEKNSGVAGGVVGPKGYLNRAIETVGGVLPGQESAATPALTTQSKKELIVANVRKLISGGGVFSNQDAKRLDDALSMGLMSTPGSAQQGLNDLKSFLREKRQSITSLPSSQTKPKAEDFFR